MLKKIRQTYKRQGFLDGWEKYHLDKVDRGLKRKKLQVYLVKWKSVPKKDRLEVEKNTRSLLRRGEIEKMREEALSHPLRPVYVHSPTIRKLLVKEGFLHLEGACMMTPEGVSRRKAKQIRDETIKEYRRPRKSRLFVYGAAKPAEPEEEESKEEELDDLLDDLFSDL